MYLLSLCDRPMYFPVALCCQVCVPPWMNYEWFHSPRYRQQISRRSRLLTVNYKWHTLILLCVRSHIITILSIGHDDHKPRTSNPTKPWRIGPQYIPSIDFSCTRVLYFVAPHGTVYWPTVLLSQSGYRLQPGTVLLGDEQTQFYLQGACAIKIPSLDIAAAYSMVCTWYFDGCKQ